MRVTVFGGSTSTTIDSDYQEAMLLGRMLGGAGHIVLTGGYTGAMEAVSRGASEAGGHVIGVTSSEIEAWRPGKPNAWVQENLRLETARERLFALIDRCDAAIALPGGAGTLAEISVLWKHMIITSARPLVIVGAAWQNMFEGMFTDLAEYVPSEHQNLVSFSPDVQAAFKRLHTVGSSD